MYEFFLTVSIIIFFLLAYACIVEKQSYNRKLKTIKKNIFLTDDVPLYNRHDAIEKMSQVQLVLDKDKKYKITILKQ